MTDKLCKSSFALLAAVLLVSATEPKVSDCRAQLRCKSGVAFWPGRTTTRTPSGAIRQSAWQSGSVSV
jgi:hypothetical protein